MAISIYQYPQVLHLTVDSIQHNCDRGQHMIVSQHYTNSLVRLFRNTDQRIDLLLKDWDRRPIKLEEWEHVWFKLFDGTREVMEKEASLLDFDRGHYILELTSTHTGALELGDYSWCIVVKDTQLSTTRMLWTNQDYGAAAPARVIEGPLPSQPEAIAIIPGNLTQLSGEWVSSALVGAAQMSNPAGVHSLVLGLNAYSGTLTVQGTLDADIPATDEDWTNVSSTVYAAVTDTRHLSVVGNYNWLRLSFTTKDGITSISYRNA